MDGSSPSQIFVTTSSLRKCPVAQLFLTRQRTSLGISTTSGKDKKAQVPVKGLSQLLGEKNHLSVVFPNYTWRFYFIQIVHQQPDLCGKPRASEPAFPARCLHLFSPIPFSTPVERARPCFGSSPLGYVAHCFEDEELQQFKPEARVLVSLPAGR